MENIAVKLVSEFNKIVMVYEKQFDELSEKEIRFCANLAGSFSKASHSSSVPVDYTLIKYIKKIPGLKGCEVTYTNQKTIYIDPKL